MSADDYTPEQREELRERIEKAIPEGTPIMEVIAALGTVLSMVCGDHGLEPERVIKAMSAALVSFNRRTMS